MIEPVNSIALILIFGLQMIFVGQESDRTWVKVCGAIMLIIGWILNSVAIFIK